MVKLALDDRALGSSVNPDGSAGNLEKRRQVDVFELPWTVGDRQHEVTCRFTQLLFVFRLMTTRRWPRAGTASPGSTALPRVTLISAV